MIEQGKKCSSPYHYRQQLHRHQYAPFNKFSCLQYRRSQRQAASGTHQQPNTTKNGIQPNIILIHTTQTKIKNLVHWHTIELSDNNRTLDWSFLSLAPLLSGFIELTLSIRPCQILALKFFVVSLCVYLAATSRRHP